VSGPFPRHVTLALSTCAKAPLPRGCITSKSSSPMLACHYRFNRSRQRRPYATTATRKRTGPGGWRRPPCVWACPHACGFVWDRFDWKGRWVSGLGIGVRFNRRLPSCCAGSTKVARRRIKSGPSSPRPATPSNQRHRMGRHTFKSPLGRLQDARGFL